MSVSSFKLYSPEGIVVMIDPWLTDDPIWPLSERTPEKLKEIDIIAVTHAHMDHASGVMEILQNNPDASVIAQYEYALSLLGTGLQNIIPTGLGATVDFRGIKFSMVPASHTSSRLLANGRMEPVGTAAGYVIEFEDGQKVYIAGDTGLTADMKFVVGDYHKPDIAILPAIGLFMMEPEQAAYAASVTGCRYAIPCHDFPRSISEAACPEAYREFVESNPVLGTGAKVDRFMEIIRDKYPSIKPVYIPIGDYVEIT